MTYFEDRKTTLHTFICQALLEVLSIYFLQQSIEYTISIPLFIDENIKNQ